MLFVKCVNHLMEKKRKISFNPEVTKQAHEVVFFPGKVRKSLINHLLQSWIPQEGQPPASFKNYIIYTKSFDYFSVLAPKCSEINKQLQKYLK